MNALDTEINQLESELEALKQAQMDFETKKGKFDEHLKRFFKDHEMPEQFNLVQLIKHFRRKSLIET